MHGDQMQQQKTSIARRSLFEY